MKATITIATLVLGLGTNLAMAQTHLQNQAPAPNSATGGDGTLSQKLGRSEGVIHPQTDVDPGISKPAPVPNPGSTPVIPPPGSPGGNQGVQPK